MTEVMEMVQVALDAKHSKEDCPFCREKDEDERENDTEEHDEENEGDNEEASNDRKNSSGRLAKALGNRPYEDAPEILEGEARPVEDIEIAGARKREWHQWIYEAGLAPMLYAAHHLIPGNAALKKSELNTADILGPVQRGKHKKNIGYNVNGAKNGVWLAANYAMRPWSSRSEDFKKAYAFLAMNDSDTQFHDAHPTYSETVLEALNDLYDEMDHLANQGCPACGKGEDESDPPYHLNARLNAISSWLRPKLMGDPTTWSTERLYTSDWARKYKKWIEKHGSHKRTRLDELRKTKS